MQQHPQGHNMPGLLLIGLLDGLPLCFFRRFHGGIPADIDPLHPQSERKNGTYGSQKIENIRTADEPVKQEAFQQEGVFPVFSRSQIVKDQADRQENAQKQQRKIGRKLRIGTCPQGSQQRCQISLPGAAGAFPAWPRRN